MVIRLVKRVGYLLDDTGTEDRERARSLLIVIDETHRTLQHLMEYVHGAKSVSDAQRTMRVVKRLRHSTQRLAVWYRISRGYRGQIRSTLSSIARELESATVILETIYERNSRLVV
jgi:hypothetical protein